MTLLRKDCSLLSFFLVITQLINIYGDFIGRSLHSTHFVDRLLTLETISLKIVYLMVPRGLSRQGWPHYWGLNTLTSLNGGLNLLLRFLRDLARTWSSHDHSCT